MLMKTRPEGNSLEMEVCCAINVRVVLLQRTWNSLLLCLQWIWKNPRKKILLVDREDNTYERSILALGVLSMATPTQVLRGELLEAIPEAEQALDFHRIALVGIDHKFPECRTADLIRLSDVEANLLLAISSTESRYETFFDRKRLDFGQQLSVGNQVSVSAKGFTKDLSGVVWYNCELPSGTTFVVSSICSAF